MPQRNIFAYTPPVSQPPYLSLNEVAPGRVTITVRSAYVGEHAAMLQGLGHGCMELPRTELEALHAALGAYLEAT